MQNSNNYQSAGRKRYQESEQYSKNEDDYEHAKSEHTVSVSQMIKFALQKKNANQDFQEQNTGFYGNSSEQGMFDLRAPYEDNLEDDQFEDDVYENQLDRDSNDNYDPSNIVDVSEKLKKYSKQGYRNSNNSFFNEDRFAHSDFDTQSVRRKNNFVQKNYAQDVVSSGRNTLGKQYTDEFKRNFAKKFLAKVQGLDKNMINTMLTREADRIKVYPNQVAVWVGIYRIALRIENQNIRRQMTEEQAVLLVEECLVQYLNNNPFQKKYRFIRVANGSFRALGIRKCTGDYWLKGFLKRFQAKFDPRIDLNQLMNGNKRDRQYHSTKLDQQLFGGSGASHQLQINRFDSSKPLDFKKQIVEKIDQTIEIGIQKIFRDKQKEVGTNINILKNWYRNYGKYNLFRDHERHEQSYSQRTMMNAPPQIVSHNGKSEAMNKIQKMVLQFIRDQPNCTRAKIQSEANEILSAIKVPQLQVSRIARAWLTEFLTRNCIRNGDSYQLKDSSLKPAQPKLPGTIHFQARQQNHKKQE